MEWGWKHPYLKYEKILLPDKISLSDKEMDTSIDKFKEYMLKRHTVRDFSDREVDFDIIKKAIQIAGSAPSGANHQPWHFVAIHSTDIKKQIRPCHFFTPLQKFRME